MKTYYDYLVEALEEAHRDSIENRHMQFTVYADRETEGFAEITEEEAKEMIFTVGDVAGGNSIPNWIYNSEAMIYVKRFRRETWIAEDVYEDYKEAVRELKKFIEEETKKEKNETFYGYFLRLAQSYPEAYADFEKEAIELECEYTDVTYEADKFFEKRLEY